jgi:NTE family protein
MRADLQTPLKGLDPSIVPDLDALAAGAHRIDLTRGDVLIRQGDEADVLYFVLSGRLTAHVDGIPQPIGEIAQGQTVGEVGFFAHDRRGATVKALRDSSLLVVTREHFEQVCRSFPALRDAVILSLAQRVSERAETFINKFAAPRTIALVPAGGGRISPRFIARLRDVFETRRSFFLTQRDIVDRFPRTPLDDRTVTSWLNAREQDAELIFYLADDTLTPWTRTCIRQADVVLMVATAGASVELNASEIFAFSIHAPSARRLVLLHEARTAIASGTSAWLANRDVFMHHHVAVQDARDVERLARFLSGRARGFVAGGGGALGSAHLGVYKAFTEAGADFDILGGTSVGAAMTAALSYGVTPERVDDGTCNIFVRSKAFRRYTLPRFSLIDHTVFDRVLREELQDVVIEDLWKPYFAVSTDLGRRKLKIHRRGPVWQAVRASGSIPGVLPPFFSREGEMLVDGGLIDNVPLAPMKALKTGPNVVVAFGHGGPKTYHIDYDAIPSRGRLLATWLNPFRRRSWPKVPSLLQVIMLSMVANRGGDLPLGENDILLQPRLPGGMRFTNWERHTEAFQFAHRETSSWIAAQIADGDPKLLALMGARDGA